MAGAKLIPVAALAALSLAACNDTSRGGVASAGGKLCAPFTATPATAAPAAPSAAVTVAPTTDGSAGVDDCLHRWGYALAASSDPAEAVAQATVAACAATISRWNQQAIAPVNTSGVDQQVPSLVTGENTNAVAERYNYAQGRALFYVVQARAGKCSAPAMANGAPVGLAPVR
jgi:hypothetical protein